MGWVLEKNGKKDEHSKKPSDLRVGDEKAELVTCRVKISKGGE